MAQQPLPLRRAAALRAVHFERVLDPSPSPIRDPVHPLSSDERATSSARNTFLQPSLSPAASREPLPSLRSFMSPNWSPNLQLPLIG
eukprot:3256748-Prymnesium_polylepis.2